MRPPLRGGLRRRRAAAAPRILCGGAPAMPMGARDVVHLDRIDGFGFERLCAAIFERGGWGRVERLGGVADGGRDLVIHGISGALTVVECKHRPNAAIGRPTVQKLHSAVISSGASRGIIITTGRYSGEAVAHAKELSKSVPIDLFAYSHLVDLADRAGIRLVSGRRDSQILRLPALTAEEARGAILGAVAALRSHPRRASDLAGITDHVLVLRPYYVLTADIEQDFATSVGLIRSVSESGLCLAYDAESGEVLDEHVALFDAWTAPREHAGADPGVPVERRRFRHGADAAVSAVTGHLCRAYTGTVRYTGRNNVTYTKLCKVSPKSVHFTDIRQVLLPSHAATVRLLRFSYPCTVDGISGGSTAVLSDRLGTCGTCGSRIQKGAALCNTCGLVHHQKRLFGCGGHCCSECKKTICRRCTLWTRRLFFFKKILCDECAVPRASAQRLAES